MPGWLSGAVIYELNTATFSAAGTFGAVTERLPELSALGVNLIWLMPIHPRGKLKAKPPYGSPYAVRDYYGINPAYGTAADLRRLIDSAHGREMRVIIDVVANHTSWDSVLMEHPDFYKHDAQGNIVSPIPDWTDVAALDYSKPQVRQYMTAMLEYWLREFRLDGFRCDVAGMVPLEFWLEARPKLEKIQPELTMLAEWDDPKLLGGAFDIDYGWAVYKALKRVLMEGAPATEIPSAWEEQNRRYAPGAMHMRISDDHDEQRAVALFGVNGAMAASVLNFAMDGVPLLYNGMEVGDSTESAGDALFYELKVFWPVAGKRPEVRPFYRELIAARRSSKALQGGTVEWVSHSSGDRALALRRTVAGQQVFAAVNLSNEPVRMTHNAAIEDGYRLLFGSAALGQTIELKAWEGAIWTRTR